VNPVIKRARRHLVPKKIPKTFRKGSREFGIAEPRAVASGSKALLAEYPLVTARGSV